MAQERFAVQLSGEDRIQLEGLIGQGQHSAWVINRALILFKSDEGWSASQVATALDTSPRTVFHTKRRYVEEGLDGVLHDHPQADPDAKTTSIDAPVIRVVLDNPVASTGQALNTHRMASLYETFPAAEARRIVKRLEFHHTPKHAGGLNMAEIEFGVLSRACLKGRNPDAIALQRQVSAYETQRNAAGIPINWRFSTDDARSKFHRFYPCLSNID